jgi:tRNA(Ile)-lysidine synthase
MGPSPAVAEIRNALRESLNDLEPGDLVLAACSGGADSLALAAALAFVAPRLGLRAGAVTVDHGLQPGSAGRAADVVTVLLRLGLEPVESVAVTVPGAAAPGPPNGPRSAGGPGGHSPHSHSGHGGPEAAARSARYQALEEVARRAGAAAVLLGHTLDDQAETVLLGLARGSGARSLAGMRARRGLFRRPLLPVRRSVTRAACASLSLPPWEDPHNADPRFSRARVRHDVMPVLEAALGPGVAEALARTASLLRADADLLDSLAEMEAARAAARAVPADDGPPGPPGPARSAGAAAREARTGLLAEHLAGLPPAIRSRVLHAAAVAAGCPPGSLTACHVQQLDALVTGWRGQRWIDLPGGIRALRRDGQLRFDREGGRGRGRHGDRSQGDPDQRGEAAPAGGGARGAD